MAGVKYKDWLTEEGLRQLELWAKEGLTNGQIAHNIGIKRETFSRWLNKHDQINHVIKKGREESVIAVENAMFKKAIGFVGEDGKYYPPDTGAGAFILKNWKKDRYRDKPLSSAELQAIELNNEKIRLEVEKLRNEVETNDSDTGIREALVAAAESIWEEEDE